MTATQIALTIFGYCVVIAVALVILGGNRK